MEDSAYCAECGVLHSLSAPHRCTYEMSGICHESPLGFEVGESDQWFCLLRIVNGKHVRVTIEVLDP